jgi:hypothetical protein
MELIETYNEFSSKIGSFFTKYGVCFRKDLSLLAFGLLRCGQANGQEIARALGAITGRSFKTNDMRVYNMLKNDKFQVDEALWRCHFKLVFSFLTEQGLQPGDHLHITIDTTSVRDDFLILTASVRFKQHSFPLYFSMRNYPHRPAQMDQQKFEGAFFKALRHMLSKKYQYVVVGDRGFSHKRIIDLCRENDFRFIFRMNDNFNYTIDGIDDNLSNISGNKLLDKCFIPAFDRELTVVCRENNEGRWLLVTDMAEWTETEIGAHYAGRFPIEHMFRQEKSAGFDIERTKIKKYDRFKRLHFIGFMAQAIMEMLGGFIQSVEKSVKKKLQTMSRKTLSLFTLAQKAIRYYAQEALGKWLENWLDDKQMKLLGT